MKRDSYIIQNGDDFYKLAQRFGGSCDDWIRANPGINPTMLQVGQKVVLPEIKPELGNKQQYAEIGVDHGEEFAGDHMDDIEMEIAGVRFRVKRVGESRIPHEVHMILPRVEVRKIEPAGENGPSELQLMISNVNIVHSPRLKSEGGEKLKIESGEKKTEQTLQTDQTWGAGASSPAGQMDQMGQTSQMGSWNQTGQMGQSGPPAFR